MHHRPKYWYLKQFNLFDGLKEEDFVAINDFSIEHFFNKKELLFSPGDKLDRVFILKEGEITLYQLHNGKKVILDILKPGSFFGNIAMEVSSESTYFAEASDNIMICAMTTDSFLAVIQRYPQVILRLLHMVTEKMREYEGRITSSTTLSAKESVLDAIRNIKKKDEQNFLPKVLWKNTKITHDKLASMTGLARETVTKAIAELESEKAIQVKGREIVLPGESPVSTKKKSSGKKK